MKIVSVLTLVGLAISFAFPTFAQQTNTPDPQLRQQLLTLAKKFDDAINKNDAAALAALYTEDAVLVTITVQSTVGRPSRNIIQISFRKCISATGSPRISGFASRYRYGWQ